MVWLQLLKNLQVALLAVLHQVEAKLVVLVILEAEYGVGQYKLVEEFEMRDHLHNYPTPTQQMLSNHHN